MARLVGELDAACAPLLDAAPGRSGPGSGSSASTAIATSAGPSSSTACSARPGSCTSAPARSARSLDTFTSRAFAVCDHQLAHVYVARRRAISSASATSLRRQPGVARVLAGRGAGGDRPRPPASGELVALSEPDAWFAYPYWLDDRLAPDFARTVDIHRKPGYDPCELFFDPRLLWPKGRAIRRLIQKKLGFRTLFDVVPLDPSLVRGSHGLPAASPRTGRS